jgi:putative pyruvate formate lyase activating enzyme
MFKPSYIELFKTGELQKRIKVAHNLLRECRICPRKCGVNRLVDEREGVCQAGLKAMVSSYGPHFGEERCLVGLNGSGTIFLTSCSLRCLYCQNYDISHLRFGDEVTTEQLARMMIELQNIGCHNINFVTPTHFVPQILAALPEAIKQGLNVPLVYNTGGYDIVETLQLLDGIFDIYMPDIKYAEEDKALKFSGARDYPQVVKLAVKEMHRQVGNLELDERGIALRGLLVRHLVLPEGIAGTREIMRFLAKEISINTYVNIMDQYHPCFKAFDNPPLDRSVTRAEFEEAIRIAEEEGITRLDKRISFRF